MQTGLIDSLGKLSIEVVAILTLAYMVWSQGKGHDKMSKSLDRLTQALSKKLSRDQKANIAFIKSIDQIDKTLTEHSKWSKEAIDKLSKKNPSTLHSS